MDRELARKSPAKVINSHAINPLERRVGGVTMQEVEAKVNYLYRRGQILPEYNLRYRTFRPNGKVGQWEAVVTLKPRPSWLRRNGIKLVLIGFGANFALAAGYLLVKLVAMAIVALIPAMIGIALLLAAASLLAGREVIEVVQRVTIRR